MYFGAKMISSIIWNFILIYYFVKSRWPHYFFLSSSLQQRSKERKTIIFFDILPQWSGSVDVDTCGVPQGLPHFPQLFLSTLGCTGEAVGVLTQCLESVQVWMGVIDFSWIVIRFSGCVALWHWGSFHCWSWMGFHIPIHGWCTIYGSTLICISCSMRRWHLGPGGVIFNSRAFIDSLMSSKQNSRFWSLSIKFFMI